MVAQPVATLGKQADGFGNLLRQRMIRVSECAGFPDAFSEGVARGI
jgi:hypothetical protein